VRKTLVCSNHLALHIRWHSITEEGPIMFYAISWFVVVALVASWSLAAWALHAVAVWTLSNAGALSGAAGGAATLRLPDWLAPWVPTEIAQPLSQMLAGLGPLVGSLLQAAPAVAGGVTVATSGWLGPLAACCC
jgi:hypothetical protein